MPEPHAGDLTPLGRYVRMAFFREPAGNSVSLEEWFFDINIWAFWGFESILIQPRPYLTYMYTNPCNQCSAAAI